jgi:NitT/TauT family transport system permease protein
MREFIQPNEPKTPGRVYTLFGVWFLVWIGYWTAFRPEIFPSPLEVVQAFPTMWFENGLGQEVVTSFIVNVQAIGISAILGLGLAYLSTVQAVFPLVEIVSKLRFVSPVVFFFVLTQITSTGHQLKLALLVMGMVVFFVTTMASIVANIPRERFDHARTLRMTEWLTVWYVIIQGTRAQALDTIRDNAAMGWAMLTMVEGIVRSEGGVGVLILDQNKHFNLANVYAAAVVIIAVGFLQDWLIGKIREYVAPEAALITVKR